MINVTKMFKFKLPWLIFLAFFITWTRFSIVEMQTILTQGVSAIIFYLPFYFIVSRLLSFHENQSVRSLDLIFTIILSGLLSLLILNYHLDPVVGWLSLFIISVIIYYPFRAKKEITTTQCSPSVWPQVLFAILLVFNLFDFAGNGPFYPPHSCDASLIHLSLPKIYAHNGGWINGWWVRAPFLPQLMHTQYALQMQLLKALGIRSDLLGQITNVILLWSIIRSSRIVLSEKTSYLFGSGLLTLSLTRLNLAHIHMDLPATTMLVGMTMFLILSYKKPSFISGLLLGCLIAGAVGTKHQTLIFAIPILIAWFIARRINYPLHPHHIMDWKYIGGATITFIPLFIFIFFHNWQITGNPLFPFLFSQDPSGFHWDTHSLSIFNSAISHWLKDKSPIAMIKSFYEITQETSPYSDNHGFHTSLSLFMAMIFFLTGLLKSKLRQVSVMLTLLLVTHYASWYYSSPVIRYIFPTTTLSIIAIFYFLESFKSKFISLITFLCFTAFLVHSQYDWIKNLPRKIPTHFEEVKSYYKENTLTYNAYEWLDHNTPEDSLIYTYGGSCEWLNLPRAFFGDWFGDTGYHILNTGSVAEINSFLKRTQPDFILQANFIVTTVKSQLRRLSDFNENGVCINPKAIYTDDKQKIYQVLKEGACAPVGTSKIKTTVPYQPKGLNFFFR